MIDPLVVILVLLAVLVGTFFVFGFVFTIMYMIQLVRRQRVENEFYRIKRAHAWLSELADRGRR